jgi:hypothetical protein
MIHVFILEDHDIIEHTDFVRQLSLTYTGQSDYVQTSSTYSGSPINRQGWMPAWISCPYWIGKTVGEFRRGALKIGKHDCETTNYEFVRGPIPDGHLEPLSREELRLAEYAYRCVKETKIG